MALKSQWEQGEHVAIIGDTGSGKTYLESRLLRYRDYVVVLKNKADDDDKKNWAGYKVVKSERDVKLGNRYFLFPDPKKQMLEFGSMLRRAYDEGGWTVVVDELYYLEHNLKLTEEVNTLLTQGRSLGITVVIGAQRPVLISRFALSQCKHTFCFVVEGRDAKTISETTTPRMRDVITQLPRFSYAYYNRTARTIATGNAQSLPQILGARPQRPEDYDSEGY